MTICNGVKSWLSTSNKNWMTPCDRKATRSIRIVPGPHYEELCEKCFEVEIKSPFVTEVKSGAEIFAMLERNTEEGMA